MTARSIGLDIGTFAVRAAQVSVKGGEVTLERFGQVTLPPGAVIAGEVQDPVVVGDALKALWHGVDFASKKVVVGVSSSRVILRQADFPSMPKNELRAALEFGAADLIPMPMTDAYLDFDLLGETVSDDGSSRSQILLAAAHRRVVDAAVDAARAGGLSVGIVDPGPLALVRALSRPSTDVLGEDIRTEALVAMGAGVTALVIHENGVPRFVRLSSHGGEDVTARLGAELHLSQDDAEDLKRRMGAVGPDAMPEGAALVVASAVGALVSDIAGALEFYADQTGVSPVSRVVLTGGGSLTAGLMRGLASELGLPVESADPGALVRIGGVALDDSAMSKAGPLLAVPVGLALAGIPGMPATVNLLPPDLVAQRRRNREMAAVAGSLAVVAAGLALAGVGRAHEISHQKQVLAADQAQVSNLQTQVQKLAYVSNTEAKITAGSSTIKAALAGDVDWVGVLNQVATSMPSSVWMTSFTGKGPTSTAAGTATISASGTNQQATAAWITDEGQSPALSQVWVSSSSRSAVGQVVSISSTANLTSATLANRAGQFGASSGKAG